MPTAFGRCTPATREALEHIQMNQENELLNLDNDSHPVAPAIELLPQGRLTSVDLPAMLDGFLSGNDLLACGKLDSSRTRVTLAAACLAAARDRTPSITMIVVTTLQMQSWLECELAQFTQKLNLSLHCTPVRFAPKAFSTFFNQFQQESRSAIWLVRAPALADLLENLPDGAEARIRRVVLCAHDTPLSTTLKTLDEQLIATLPTAQRILIGAGIEEDEALPERLVRPPVMRHTFGDRAVDTSRITIETVFIADEHCAARLATLPKGSCVLIEYAAHLEPLAATLKAAGRSITVLTDKQTDLRNALQEADIVLMPSRYFALLPEGALERIATLDTFDNDEVFLHLLKGLSPQGRLTCLLPLRELKRIDARLTACSLISSVENATTQTVDDLPPYLGIEAAAVARPILTVRASYESEKTSPKSTSSQLEQGSELPAERQPSTSTSEPAADTTANTNQSAKARRSQRYEKHRERRKTRASQERAQHAQALTEHTSAANEPAEETLANQAAPTSQDSPRPVEGLASQTPNTGARRAKSKKHRKERNSHKASEAQNTNRSKSKAEEDVQQKAPTPKKPGESKANKRTSDEAPTPKRKRERGAAGKSVNKFNGKPSRGEGKMEKSRRNNAVTGRRQQKAQQDQWDDDNFGNSIYYQPKRQNLRTLRSDQPMHWEPEDPFHPASQALTLPQNMPDEFPARQRQRPNRSSSRNNGPMKKRQRKPTNRGR